VAKKAKGGKKAGKDRARSARKQHRGSLRHVEQKSRPEPPPNTKVRKRGDE
jgi:hypothetical protein